MDGVSEMPAAAGRFDDGFGFADGTGELPWLRDGSAVGEV